jgi:hypothetical protein
VFIKKACRGAALKAFIMHSAGAAGKIPALFYARTQRGRVAGGRKPITILRIRRSAAAERPSSLKELCIEVRTESHRADKAYDTNELFDIFKEADIAAVIPPVKSRKEAKNIPS